MTPLREGGGSKLQLLNARGDLTRGWGRPLCSTGTSCVMGFSRFLKIRERLVSLDDRQCSVSSLCQALSTEVAFPGVWGGVPAAGALALGGRILLG